MKNVTYFSRDLAFSQLKSLCDTHAVYALYSAPENTIETFNQLTNHIFKLKKSKNVGLLLKRPFFFPYLSLMDNLLLKCPISKAKRKKHLLDWFGYLDLSFHLLLTNFEMVTTYEKVKLQLLQLLLSEKHLIIITDIFSDLSIYERQLFLPLLKKTAVDHEKCIILLTSDTQIIESPYVLNM